MKILAISDINGLQWKDGSGEAELLVSCGDVPDEIILEAADAWHCKRILAVKGNHDRGSSFDDPIEDLHLHVREHQHISFGGFNGSWQYKPRGHYLHTQNKASELLSSFPPVDVFVSHNSPRGIHDKDDNVHYGFNALNSYIQRTHPSVLIHGHQHVNVESMLQTTRIVGVYGHRVLEVDSDGG